MKEKIVIKDEIFADFLIENKDNHNISASPKVIMDRCRVEQVPETFEELKELCKKTGHYAVNILKGGLLNKEYIFIFGLSFRDNGDIEDIENDNIVENRTPAQMWQIIKNLIGEE